MADILMLWFIRFAFLFLSVEAILILTGLIGFIPSWMCSLSLIVGVIASVYFCLWIPTSIAAIFEDKKTIKEVLRCRGYSITMLMIFCVAIGGFWINSYRYTFPDIEEAIHKKDIISLLKELSNSQLVLNERRGYALIKALSKFENEKVIDAFVSKLYAAPSPSIPTEREYIGEEAKPYFIKDKRIKKRIIDVLEEMGVKVVSKRDKAIRALIDVFFYDDSNEISELVRKKLQKSFVHYLTADHFLPKLKERDYQLRIKAANFLVEIEDKKVISALSSSLADWYVGGIALNFLRKSGWSPASIDNRVYIHIIERNGNVLRKTWPETKGVLLKDVKSEDYNRIENALYAFIGIGQKEIIPELISILDKKGDKTMAEAFLNCGHPELHDSAENWAHRHGYRIVAGKGAHPVVWGQF